MKKLKKILSCGLGVLSVLSVTGLGYLGSNVNSIIKASAGGKSDELTKRRPKVVKLEECHCFRKHVALSFIYDSLYVDDTWIFAGIKGGKLALIDIQEGKAEKNMSLPTIFETDDPDLQKSVDLMNREGYKMSPTLFNTFHEHGVESINFDNGHEKNGTYVIREGVLYEKHEIKQHKTDESESLTLAFYPSNKKGDTYRLPSQLKDVEKYAFGPGRELKNRNLKKIDFKDVSLGNGLWREFSCRERFPNGVTLVSCCDGGLGSRFCNAVNTKGCVVRIVSFCDLYGNVLMTQQASLTEDGKYIFYNDNKWKYVDRNGRIYQDKEIVLDEDSDVNVLTLCGDGIVEGEKNVCKEMECLVGDRYTDGYFVYERIGEHAAKVTDVLIDGRSVQIVVLSVFVDINGELCRVEEIDDSVIKKMHEMLIESICCSECPRGYSACFEDIDGFLYKKHIKNGNEVLELVFYPSGDRGRYFEVPENICAFSKGSIGDNRYLQVVDITNVTSLRVIKNIRAMLPRVILLERSREEVAPRLAELGYFSLKLCDVNGKFVEVQAVNPDDDGKLTFACLNPTEVFPEVVSNKLKVHGSRIFVDKKGNIYSGETVSFSEGIPEGLKVRYIRDIPKFTSKDGLYMNEEIVVDKEGKIVDVNVERIKDDFVVPKVFMTEDKDTEDKDSKGKDSKFVAVRSINERAQEKLIDNGFERIMFDDGRSYEISGRKASDKK